MIIIEGPRNTGKTYLLDHYLKEFPNKFFTYKFPYFDFYQELELDKELNAGNYFSFGKDLDLLSLAKSNLLPNNLILDRGFVSSIVFAMIFRNTKEEQMVKYIELIKEHYKTIPIDIVYIEPDEQSRQLNNIATVRDKDEVEVDSLNLSNSYLSNSTYAFKYSWVLDQLRVCPNFKIHQLTNHFNEESVAEFNNLIDSLYK